MLLGVRAVIAESFERIHRSNLVAWACCRWCSAEYYRNGGILQTLIRKKLNEARQGAGV
jgi:aconitase A